jgi:hypothetical protein
VLLVCPVFDYARCLRLSRTEIVSCQNKKGGNKWDGPPTQDEDDNPSLMRQTIRLAARSIMQEAMLSGVDIYKPQYIVSIDLGILNYTKTPKLTGTTYTVTPKQMAQRKIPM